MAIRNVESILPDREYIAALELELRELRAEVAQLRADIVAARS